MAVRTIHVSESAEISNQARQGQTEHRRANSEMKASASLTKQIWEDYVRVKASDGSEIHVCKPRYAGLGPGIMIFYDDRDRVIIGAVSEDVAADSKFDGKSWRIASGFDYSIHGMRKIGSIWVDANNPTTVSRAQALANTTATSCVIL